MEAYNEELTEAEEIRRGEMLAEVLELHKCQTESGRYDTRWGTKTPLGLFRTVKRIIEEGK